MVLRMLRLSPSPPPPQRVREAYVNDTDIW